MNLSLFSPLITFSIQRLRRQDSDGGERILNNYQYTLFYCAGRLQLIYPDIDEIRFVFRAFGSAGDMVLFLKDGAKVSSDPPFL